ncbi:MAG TPA: hypothetical protein ENK83_00940, partial [Aliiroseovarius sp.]|nr:hypothetical protein [Aliiroseovarius sp.]
MKPNFALNLSHDGISLLHRNEGSKLGWSLVGEVALDDPEMTDKLEMLRKTAAGLDQSGVATKLVIPASQILFTEVTTNAADDISREVQIREALEGLTPYEVGELVFDWRRAKGKAVKVAVVARETLQEAESFARDHRFNPVSFVTRGQQGFRGEAFFGMAAGAAAFLGAGVHVDADQKSIPKIAALRPQDPEEPDNAAAPKADETAKLAPTSTPDLHEAEQQEDLSAQEKPAAVDQPASKDAPDTATPAVEADEKAPETAQTPPPLADEASPEASDEDARIAALLAEVPEPAQEGPGDLNGTATPETPARKEAQPEESKAKATPKKKSAATPPPKPAAVLAPFPPSLDVEDTPRPAATPRPKTAAKPSAKPAKPVAKPKPPVAAKPEVKSSLDEKQPAETRAEPKQIGRAH